MSSHTILRSLHAMLNFLILVSAFTTNMFEENTCMVKLVYLNIALLVGLLVTTGLGTYWIANLAEGTEENRYIKVYLDMRRRAFIYMFIYIFAPICTRLFRVFYEERFLRVHPSHGPFDCDPRHQLCASRRKPLLFLLRPLQGRRQLQGRLAQAPELYILLRV